MSENTEKARAEIDGTKVARLVIEFMREFRGSYDMATVGLCAVGPLQTMLGFAISKGYLKEGENL